MSQTEGVLYLETRSAATKTMTSWLEDNNANERHSSLVVFNKRKVWCWTKEKADLGSGVGMIPVQEQDQTKGGDGVTRLFSKHLKPELLTPSDGNHVQ